MKKILFFLAVLLTGLLFFNKTTNVSAEECSHYNYNSKNPRYDINPCKPKPQECAGRSFTNEDIANLPFNIAGKLAAEIQKKINEESYKKTYSFGLYECWPAGATPRTQYEPTICPAGMDLVNNQCCINDPLVVPSYCVDKPSTPVCPYATFRYNPNTNKCEEVFPEDTAPIKILKPIPCKCLFYDKGKCEQYEGIQTSLGCFPTDPKNLVSWLFMVAIGIGGGIAFLMCIFGAFLFMTSGGDPEKLKEAQSTLTASIMGILFIIFSVFLLRLIGFTILKIPGWQ